MRRAIHVGHPDWARCSERSGSTRAYAGAGMKHWAGMRVRSVQTVAEVEMELLSLSGNSQQLAGGAMVARPTHGPHVVLRAGSPAASGFVPDESMVAEA